VPLQIGIDLEARRGLDAPAGFPRAEAVTIKAIDAAIAVVEDAAVEDDLRVIGEHLDDVVVEALVERSLERLMKPANRLLVLEQGGAERAVVRSVGCRPAHRGRRGERGRDARPELPEERATADVGRVGIRCLAGLAGPRHACIPLFGPKYSSTSNFPMCRPMPPVVERLTPFAPP